MACPSATGWHGWLVHPCRASIDSWYRGNLTSVPCDVHHTQLWYCSLCLVGALVQPRKATTETSEESEEGAIRLTKVVSKYGKWHKPFNGAPFDFRKVDTIVIYDLRNIEVFHCRVFPMRPQAIA